ncbi:MAG: hypothetical protein RIT35_178 [Pseudomonadota bacterium]|jgi:outer membrane protein assembly factor BamD
MSLLISCAKFSTEKPDEVMEPVNVIYNKAMDQLAAQDYEAAADSFAKVQEDSYSSWSNKAQVMEAYAKYKAKEYEDSLVILEEYAKLYPASSDMAYVLYLKSLCYFEQVLDEKRDQSPSEQALEAMNHLIARFPSSIYAADAKLKINLLFDHLAGHEMTIGRFYQTKGDVISAVNRFATVIQKYSTTSHVKEALYRLTECYMLLGIRPEAEKYAAILGHNYPDSKWYHYSYNLLHPKKK